MNEQIADKINKVQEAWSAAVTETKLTNEEALKCAGHFLANVIIAVAATEAEAHELMNRIIEGNHAYINIVWPAAQRARAKFEEQQARKQAQAQP